MLTGGEALEDYAENRAKREMTALLSNAPRRAHVIRGQKEVDVSVSSVKMGDKIVIRPGEVVPVDAVILDGSANFDESSLTGESLPEEKTVGTELLSGAINVDGTVTAKAVRADSESQYEQIVKLVRNAAASRAPFVRMADADLPEGMMVYVELLDSEGNTVGDNTYLITPDSNGQVVLDGLDPSVVRSVSFAYYHPNYPEQFMSELQTEEVAYECWAKEVTPIAPTATTVCGANNDAMALPEIDGVTYSLVGWINGVLHVTATANDGYMFPEGVTTSWTFNDANTTCPQVLGDTTVAPSLPAPKLEDTGTNPIVVLMVSLTTIGTAVGVMLRRKQFADEVN
jgi:hypothetical protein